MPCPWCGTGLPPPRSETWHVEDCRSCGVGVTRPWPTVAELDRAYSGFYRPASGRFSGPGDRVLKRSRARLATRIDRLAPAGPVLDVGSGDGTLVAALEGLGREARGLEREDPPMERLSESYAAVVLWHALEHMPEPAITLRAAVDRLLPRGLLCVAVPNHESWQARFFGEAWFATDLPRHLVHLPASALTASMRRQGLRVTRVSHWRGGQVVFGWLHGLTKRLFGGDLYDAIRRPQARAVPLGNARRARLLGGAVLFLPLAAALAGAEILAGRGGTVYVEARRG